MWKETQLKLLILSCCCCYYLAAADKQRKAVDSGRVVFNQNADGSQETVRMIDSAVPKQEVDNTELEKNFAFYNQNNDNFTTQRIRRPVQQSNSIPLGLLRRLNEENDVLGIIDKYVANVKVKDVRGQKILVDLDGRTVGISAGGLGGYSEETTTTARPSHLINTKFKFRVPMQPQTTTMTPVIVAPQGGGAPGSSGPGNNSIMFATTTFSFPTSKPMSTFLRSGVSHRGPILNRIGPASTAIQLITSEAKCEPETKAVPIKGYDNPDIFIHPKCVRIPQCGGCCGSNLLACEPIDTEPVQVQVRVFEYNAELGKLELTRQDKLQMEAHKTCKCDCKLKAEDCGPNQSYDEHNCKCVCRNEDESYDCVEQSNRQWNYQKCQCECYDPGFCQRGSFWNSKTCECEFDFEVCSRIGRPSGRNRRRRRDQKEKRHSDTNSASSS